MIPDFPEEKARLWIFWNAYLRKRVEHYSGFVNMLTSFTHHEGDRFSYDQAEGKTQESEYEPIQGEFKMHLSEARREANESNKAYFPELLAQNPMLLLLFSVIYPQRFTKDVMKLIDESVTHKTSPDRYHSSALP